MQHLWVILAVAAGGGLGASSRFAVSLLIGTLAGRDFPWATMLINIAGSFALGFVFALMDDRVATNSVWRGFVIVGFLGGFTTFSTFSLETVQLLGQSELSKALANAAGSLTLCVFGAWLGLKLGRLV